MTYRILTCLLTLTFLFSGASPLLASQPSQQPPISPAAAVPTQAAVSQALHASPVTSIENAGQFTSNTPNTKIAAVLASASKVAAGWYYTCALTTGGGVKCWGDNPYGQLGDGTTSRRTSPVDVNSLTSGVTAIAAGYAHTCALTTGGGVKCWGQNFDGQVGDGTTITPRLTPVAVSGLASGVTAIIAGQYHTCALTTGGGIKCWGDNSSGQLGDGTLTDRYIPVAVSSLTSGVTAIAARGSHTCALMDAGHGGGIKCWGNNSYGQVGDGTTITPRLVPVAVSGLASGVMAMAAGGAHTCALTTDGGVKCWGDNSSGQVGDGTIWTPRLAPVDVSGLTGVTAILPGVSHTCALTMGGGIKCWGNNSYGQVGDGTTVTPRPAPVAVGGLASGVTAIASGYAHTCALTTGGGVKCWGLNIFGQVGDGTTTTPRLVPVDVVGLEGVPLYSVSGRVTDGGGQPVAGVMVSAGAAGSAGTGGSGAYTISALAAGNYTLTPSKSGYVFSPSSRTVTVPPDATGQDFVGTSKAWTLMFYQAGDNDVPQEARLTYEYTRLQPASANVNTNIVAFWDGVSSDARYDVFSSQGITTSVPQGELNTGAASSLKDFVRWAQTNYPAQHYALIISDHGSGVSGAALDVHIPNYGWDLLTPKELRQALQGLTKLDVVYMNACLMGTIESAYQLRELADFYVASESVTWGSIQPEWFIIGHESVIHAIPAISGTTSAQELATEMAWAWVLLGRNQYQRPSTISVMQISIIEETATRASALAGQIRSHMTEMKPILDQIRPASVLQHYEMNGDNEITDADEYVDLQHFASLVRSHSDEPSIQLAAGELINSTQNLVILTSAWDGTFTDGQGTEHTWRHGNSRGASIFFPPPGQRNVFYNGDWLDFAAGTNWQMQKQLAQEPSFEWGQMLVDYVTVANPGAPDNSDPPQLMAPVNILQKLYLPVVIR